MKGQNLIFILFLAAIILGTCIAMTFLFGANSTPENQGTAATPDINSHDNQFYSTANEIISQEKDEKIQEFDTNFTLSSNSSAATTETESQYTIKSYQGKIGIFLNDDSKPIRTVEVLVQMLPQSDQEMLTNGITVFGEEELRGILEDYES